ncbi:MAG: hypothetical protein ABIO92_07010 [Chloroflexia bacterium]
MGGERKSGVQKFFTGLVSASTAARMEADSRTWMLQCPKCGYERSIWDMGGIRYKAVGNSRNFMRCVNCGERSWHQMYKQLGPLPESPARVSPAQTVSTSATAPAAARRLPRWLMWTIPLGALAGVAVIVLGIVFLTFSLIQPIVDVGDGFMTALKTNNDAQAYALCAPDLQNKLGSVTGMSALVQDYRPAQWSWNTRSIRNGVGRLGGSFTSTDGKSGTVQITLRQVGDNWGIVSFRLNLT